LYLSPAASAFLLFILPPLIPTPAQYKHFWTLLIGGSCPESTCVLTTGDATGEPSNTPANPPAQGARLTPMAPVRLIDSRTPSKPLGAKLALAVQVAGRYGVPTSATGVAVNVAVVSPTAQGYLTIYADGLSSPPLASSANFMQGQTVASFAFARLGSNGRFRIYSHVTTHVIVDLVGYFDEGRGSFFHALPPGRRIDTRQTGQGGMFAANEKRTYAMRGRNGIGASATGYILNLAVVQPSTNGFVTLYPGPCTSANPPTTSSINYATGQTVANLAVGSLGSAGDLCAFAAQPTHMIMDVAGYLSPTANEVFYASNPQRLVDTRSAGGQKFRGASHLGTFGPGRQTLKVSVAASSGTATAAALRITVINQDSAQGYLTAYPCGQSLPTVSNLNYPVGPSSAVGNFAVVSVGTNSEICFYVHTTSHIIIDLQGWFVERTAAFAVAQFAVERDDNIEPAELVALSQGVESDFYMPCDLGPNCTVYQDDLNAASRPQVAHGFLAGLLMAVAWAATLV
jgi:hypothetical protein